MKQKKDDKKKGEMSAVARLKESQFPVRQGEKEVCEQESRGDGENWVWRLSQRLAESDLVVYGERLQANF